MSSSPSSPATPGSVIATTPASSSPPPPVPSSSQTPVSPSPAFTFPSSAPLTPYAPAPAPSAAPAAGAAAPAPTPPVVSVVAPPPPPSSSLATAPPSVTTIALPQTMTTTTTTTTTTDVQESKRFMDRIIELERENERLKKLVVKTQLSPSSESKLYSLTELELLSRELKDTTNRALQRNAELEAQMRTLLRQGLRSSDAVRSINILRSNLLSENGGSFVRQEVASSNGSSNSVTVIWQFENGADARRIERILSSLGFTVTVQDMNQTMLGAHDTAALLRCSSYTLSVSPSSTTTIRANPYTAPMRPPPGVSSVEDWLELECLKSYQGTNVAVRDGNKKIVSILARFSAADIIDDTNAPLQPSATLEFEGDAVAGQLIQVLRRIGLEYEAPKLNRVEPSAAGGVPGQKRLYYRLKIFV